ncbi:hypothetical protein [uncultured Kordia sp.]|uniref:hypothetical protein n=1 Tax=uncultured Kordia sp. TaxID=507699 RepID=UPI00262C0397|nr:hypothetical protein [uncultured Kordia sp.]
MAVEIKNLRIKVNVNAQKKEEVAEVEEGQTNWTSGDIINAVSKIMTNKKER